MAAAWTAVGMHSTDTKPPYHPDTPEYMPYRNYTIIARAYPAVAGLPEEHWSVAHKHPLVSQPNSVEIHPDRKYPHGTTVAP